MTSVWLLNLFYYQIISELFLNCRDKLNDVDFRGWSENISFDKFYDDTIVEFTMKCLDVVIFCLL